MKNIIDIIREHSLTVRCLPYEVVSYWTGYREGDENKKWVDSEGNPSKSKREVIIQDHDLEYFRNTPPPKWCKDSPEKRLVSFRKNFPNGRKLLKETRTVEHGGWWFVSQTKHTSSTVRFSKEHDFFAPTLEEAIQLYLDSLA